VRRVVREPVVWARHLLREWWLVAALAVAAFAASLAIGSQLYPYFTGNNDEPVYVFQARTLLDGHLTVPASLHDHFFRPWLTGEHDGRLFTQYQPGWPTVLALSDLLLGSMRVGIALVAAATVVAVGAFAHEVVGDRRVTLAAVAVFALSPLFLLHWSLFLPYGFTTLCLTAMATLLLRGARTGRTVTLVAAGAVLGVAQLTRPFDAVLFAGPVAGMALARLWPVHGAWWRALLRVAAGALPFVALTLAYNTAVTGAPFRFPLMASDPRNRFGFGTRGIVEGEPDFPYPFHAARTALGDHLEGSVGWVFGGAVAIGLAVLALVWRTRRRRCLPLLPLLLVFPAGYLFWWATYLSGLAVRNGMGPQYYVPAFVPLAVLVAVGLVTVWSWRRVAAGAVAVAMVACTAYALVDKVDLARSTTEGHREFRDAVADGVPDGSLVLLPDDARYVMSPYPYFMNRPDLGGRVVYAIDRGAENPDVLRRFPDRPAFRVRAELAPGDALLDPSVHVIPVRVDAGATVELHLRVTAPAGDRRLTAYLDADGGRTEVALDESTAAGETFDVTWTLAAPGRRSAAAGDDVVVELTGGGEGGAEVVVGVTVADPTATGVGPDRFERRFQVRLASGADGGSVIEVLRPGVGWHLAHFPAGEFWLVEDVAPVLAEIS
jgi:hypothetical protein